MPKFFKQNGKRINPRYFLNESSVLEFKDILCNSAKRKIIFTMMRNFPNEASMLLAEKVSTSIKEELNLDIPPTSIEPAIKFLISNGGASRSTEATIKDACSFSPF